MKTKLNITRKSIIAAFTAVVALTMVLTGCVKDYEMDLPLAVTSNDLSIAKEAGSTHVLVYSDGEWTARLTRPVKWASLDRTSGYGNHEIVFTYTANYGISRKVGVVFQKGALADTVMFTQAGSISDPQLLFSKKAMNLVQSAATVSSPISTNLQYALADIEASVVYYDENGLANDPIVVEMTRQDENGDEIEGEGDGEGEGEVEPEEPVANPVEPWISNFVLTKNSLTFDVAQLPDGSFPRIAEIKLSIADAEGVTTSDVLSLTQLAQSPMLALESAAGSYSGLAQSVVVPSTDNNMAPYSAFFEYEVVYAEEVELGEEWVRNVKITEEGLQFNLTVNEGDSPRVATISASYTDAMGNAVAVSYAVTQVIYPKAVEFEAVRAMTPGELEVAGYIEGYIIGDFNSKNMCGNVFAEGMNKYDRTENDRTNYIESKDGKYGFMLKYNVSNDNNIPRYSAVKIALEGLTLIKNSEPEYYTLAGLSAANILEIGAADQFKVPAKEKTIAQLTDADIFTMCTITGVEIMCKDGAYTNNHEGYTWKDGTINKIGASGDSRADQIPLRMYDRTGNSIPMLTNILVPWRRDGTDVNFYSVVPQGSGNFKGVVVHDEVAELEFGQEYMGRYQVRAMVEDDIALDEEAAFTTTLVEWNWNDGVNKLTPDIGAGTINKYSVSSSAYYDFNNTYIPQHNTNELCGIPGKPMNGETNSKGMVKQAAQRFYNVWWDHNNNVGKYFDIEFSTAGISGSNLMFGMTWMSGNLSLTSAQVPYDWAMLYSVDGGTTFNVVDNQNVKCRTTGVYSGCPIDAAPAYSELLRTLPAECFGKDKVIVRMQAISKKTASTTASTAATFATNFCQGTGTQKSGETNSNQRLCIGTITVRYN